MKMKKVEEKFSGFWVVVTDGANWYIGRVTDFEGQTINIRSKNSVLSCWNRGEIELSPGYMIPPRNSVIREDYLPYKQVMLYVKPTAMIFFKDMSEVDRRRYEQIVIDIDNWRTRQ